MKKPVLAAFDFDGTITYRDSLLPFLIYSSGPVKAFARFFLELPWLVGFMFGISTRQETKEHVLTRFFAGKKLDELDSLAKDYAETDLEIQVRPESRRRLQWHQSQGHRCVVVSASIDLYLKYWAEKNGVELLCSRIEVENGVFTGKLSGKNCWGPEKVRRLQEKYGDLDQFEMYAYGDSRGDREMFEVADHTFLKRMSEEEK